MKNKGDTHQFGLCRGFSRVDRAQHIDESPGYWTQQSFLYPAASSSRTPPYSPD